jgi:6-phosphofructokinase 1
MAGQTAVKEAVAGTTDKMVGFKCTRDENGYKCEPELLDLSSVANYEKKVPVEWINERGNDVSDEFIKYALPLIQGEIQIKKENSLPRFVHLKKVVEK